MLVYQRVQRSLCMWTDPIAAPAFQETWLRATGIPAIIYQPNSIHQPTRSMVIPVPDDSMQAKSSNFILKAAQRKLNITYYNNIHQCNYM